jgi:tripartite-type tricarboxylate transporter receptor subunit TctC
VADPSAGRGAIQAGKAVGLAISSPTRLRTLPNVPTSAEAGIPDFQQQGWKDCSRPKVPRSPFVEKLNQALGAAVASEAVQRRMDDLGALPATGEELTPEYFANLVPMAIEQYRKLLAQPKSV